MIFLVSENEALFVFCCFSVLFFFPFEMVLFVEVDGLGPKKKVAR